MKKGFSLIEILVAIVIAGLVLGVAIPSITNISRSRASSEMGNFNSFLKQMFLKAMRENSYIKVNINMANGTYWAEMTKDPIGIEDAEYAEEKESKKKSLIERFSDKSLFSDEKSSSKPAKPSNSILDLSKGSSEDDDGIPFDHTSFSFKSRSVKDLLITNYKPVGEKQTIHKELFFDSFYSYHTPQPVTVSDSEDDDEENKEALVSFFIFPEGRVEPFYISIGERESQETFFFLKSDFFLNTLIKRGSFTEDLLDFKELFKDKDEEGK